MDKQNNMSNKRVKISPNFSLQEWKNLNLDDNNSEDWNKAIAIFQDRIEGRYLKQIDVLVDRIFAGFAIMSLTCLLIEMLEQFYEGKKKTEPREGNIMFHNFFQRSAEFKIFFDDQENKTSVFYSQIRCGLAHQGQTQKKSLIHIRGNSMLEWINPQNYEDGISIQRKLFVEEVKNIYNNYVEEIKNKDSRYRQNLRIKMDFIANQE